MAVSIRRWSTTTCREIEMRCNSTHLPVFSTRVAALFSYLCLENSVSLFWWLHSHIPFFKNLSITHARTHTNVNTCRACMTSVSPLPPSCASSHYCYQGSHYRSLFSLSADKRLCLTCRSVDLSLANMLPDEKVVYFIVRVFLFMCVSMCAPETSK